MTESATLFPGTLDVRILQAVAPGELRGWPTYHTLAAAIGLACSATAEGDS